MNLFVSRHRWCLLCSDIGLQRVLSLPAGRCWLTILVRCRADSLLRQLFVVAWTPSGKHKRKGLYHPASKEGKVTRACVKLHLVML